MIINNKYIKLALRERWRIRAESCYGLILAAERWHPILSSIACENNSNVIDDGIIGQKDFTQKDFISFVWLLEQLSNIKNNSIAITALRGLIIRSDDVIIPKLNINKSINTLEDSMLIIRPLSKLIRAQRRAIEDDSRITPVLIQNLNDEDIIDEETIDNRKALVGHIKILYSLSQQMVSEDINTSDVADAIDAACTSPLICE